MATGGFEAEYGWAAPNTLRLFISTPLGGIFGGAIWHAIGAAEWQVAV
jgi:hypothetical protein